MSGFSSRRAVTAEPDLQYSTPPTAGQGVSTYKKAGGFKDEPALQSDNHQKLIQLDRADGFLDGGDDGTVADQISDCVNVGI